MFSQKRTPQSRGTTSAAIKPAKTNAFVNSGMKKAAQIRSGNNAAKYSTTGNEFVDQFATVSQYKAPRGYAPIALDMVKLWGIDPVNALRFTTYMRLVTRQVALPDGSKTQTVQRGQGMKHESILRMMWIGVNHPKTFMSNIGLFVSAGSWKDVFYMLSYDYQYHGWDNRVLDWKFLGKFILAGLENSRTRELIKKYLPTIKANSKCKTIEAEADNAIGKWLCGLLFPDYHKVKTDNDRAKYYAQYRKLKSSGTAHQWQQVISKGSMIDLNFNTIAGRALAQLVSSKFIANNGLEARYQSWIEKKPIAKFTGWPFELAQKTSHNIKPYQKLTINAQFQMLVEVAKKNLDKQGLRPISVLDCSGSMSSLMYIGNGQVGKLQSIEVAFSSALFFDEMIQSGSPFKNVYLSFSNETQMCKFTGNNFVDRYLTSPRAGWGGTNFESVFRFFANFKKNNPTVPEDQIPNFIVCFSDGEFNGVSGKGSFLKTNVEKGRELLKAAGYSKDYYENFGIGFVDMPNTFYSAYRQPKFETFGDVKNVFYFSGYDLSPLAFLFGVTGQTAIPKTASELFDAAMNQELLLMLEVQS